ncbi:MAG: response regulator [Saprospiraceae bacterium]
MLEVLIVEDDLSFALELEMLLADLGYSVASIVDNAKDALRQIASKSIDIILMDVGLKGQ